jgi:hypothetical protein
MTADFQVRDKRYHAEIRPGDKTEDEKFQLYSVAVGGQNAGAVEGTLKVTPQALELAGKRASQEGGSAEDWLARGCAKSLAAEVLIRKLKPQFSFIVDHRWIQEL